jgi:very-short-patch-repair endonuclease
MEEGAVNILDSLRVSPYPLTLRQLSSNVRRSRSCPNHVVLRELRDLLKSGEVLFENGKWRAKGQDMGHTNVSLSYSPVPLPEVSPETHALLWPERPLPTSPEEATSQLGTGTSRKGGRWGYFRELLTYYRQCVRSEENAEASAFQNQLGQTFFYLHRTGLWQPRPGVRWQTVIPLGSHLSELVNALPSAGDDSVLVLGYPVNAFYRSNEVGPATSIVSPIFFYPLEHTITTQGLQFTISEPTPEINLKWLEYAFSRKPDRQRNFLSACGFMRARMVEDGLPGMERGEASPKLENLAAALATFMPQKVRERLDLTSVPGDPLKEPFQTGIYNRSVVMLAKRTRYSRRLIQELTAIEAASDEELDNTALRHVFTASEPEEEPEAESLSDEGLVADVAQFNPSQRGAVAALLTRNVSVITGPPGTGKSQVVVGAAANARLQGQSVLISSRNHKAIDAVVHRLVDPEGNPLVIRANSKDDPNLRYTFSKAIRDMLSGQDNPQAQEKMHFGREDLLGRLKERGREGVSAMRVSTAAGRLGEIEGHLAYLGQEMPPETAAFLDSNPQAYPQKLMQAVAQSLRAATPNRSPLRDVVPGFPGLAFFLRYFLLRNRLKEIPGTPILQAFPSKAALKTLWRELDALELSREYASKRQRALSLEAEVRECAPLEEITAAIGRINERMAQILPQLLTLDLESRYGLPEHVDRAELSGLRSALNTVLTGLDDGRVDQAAKKVLRKRIPDVLQAFPVWAVTSLSVGSRLPFSPGMFNLALLDEASQSDIPSAIPILYRAKRVGVIGDPLQLTHTSKLSPAKDTLLRRNLALSDVEDLRFAYTQNSLYELCAGTRGVKTIFLNETYRSAVEIADYSSRLFYGGKLQVATDPDQLNPPPGMKSGIHWTEIDGEIQSAGGSGCHCPQEVEEVVRLARTMLEERNFKGSLGIVTPFRQQANRIQDALYEGGVAFQALQNAMMCVDTAHGFQGDERDVILFSLCAGPDMPSGSRAFLRETGNLFNVAVSRARAVLHLVGNKRWAARCGITHIERLTVSRDGATVPPNQGPWAPHESPWEKVLFEALQEAGLTPKPQFPVRNRRLDMALIRDVGRKVKLDIEVDGDCHRTIDGSRKTEDLWRDIQLQGLGWKVVRFWTYQLREDLAGCVEHIKKIWEQA